MKSSLLSLLAVAVLALAVPVMAQTELTVSGTVVSSTPTQVVVRTADGREMTFAVDAQSNVPSGLAAGNAVTVNYHDMGNNMLHAARVTTTSAGTSTTTAPSTETTRPSTTTAPSYNTAPPPTSSTRTEPMPESTAATTEATARTRKMPATASNLPLVGLAGLLSLAAGLGVRALRRQRA